MPAVEKPVSIHPTAIVNPRAELDSGVSIGPYSIIGPYVKIGSGCKVHPHVVIDGHTTIGNDNEFFPFASVGSRPQDLKFHGEPSELIVGEKNTIREYVTLQPGTEGGGMVTRIGSNNLFMANSHVGHDGIVGNGNVIANSCALAGHVIVGNNVVLGGLCAVHQFVRIGDFSMAAGGAILVKDAPPFSIVQGDRAELAGVNVIGLQRKSVSTEEIRAVRTAYRILFFAEATLPFAKRLEQVRQEYGNSSRVVELLDFIEASKRGVIFASARAASDDAATE